MLNVYQNCPIIENDLFLLRYLSEEDADDLFEVYHDKASLPFFNSDNCHGTFYCSTKENIKEAIKYWKIAYEKQEFVRWTIIDKRKNQAIGTIECFLRIAQDAFTNCALLRLDLRSDYEKEEYILELLQLIDPAMCELFPTKTIVTKAISSALERREALKKMGFYLSKEQIIGWDKTQYKDYWVLEKNDGDRE